jgi:hypothetical protein
MLLAGLTVTASAFAGHGNGSQNVGWYTVTGGSSDNVTSTSIPGHVNLNTPNGSVALIVNGEITLAPSTTYDVWVRNLDANGGYTGSYLSNYPPLGYYKLATFTTDSHGNGSFHLNLRAADLPAGAYPIQVAVNTHDTIGVTVAATVKYTNVTVGG